MRWLVVVLFGLLASSAIARADDASLDAARKAVDEIRYDDARRLLVEVLNRGANRPADVIEIYRLSAATAAVLGPVDLAEQYYRRMLALDPDATLPADASPRLREPFIAAQSYMGAQQRFEARASRSPQGIAVSIVDPLGMIVAVAALDGSELRGKQLFTGKPLVLDDIGEAVVVLDEHGNYLRVIELPARPVAAAVAPRSHRTPILRHWITWAIPAGLSAGVTTFLLIDAQRTHDRLDDILAHPMQHYFGEAEEERRRFRGHTIVGWVGVGLTLGLTTTAIVMARTRPRPVTVTPSIGSDHASVQVEAKF